MPVTLDSATAVMPGGGVGPVWLVRCDFPTCGRRTYVHGVDEAAAAAGAVQRMAWVLRDGAIWCPFHGRAGQP